ncbi:LANO_0G09582g1_1 [Lachancea nothofagi CBS 11611]|uniref:LANO_0G09582g1_1 n=1 Tax=Lachancea nothofagi CBS 11611 TaxID=1266666 RepID=A0A1G4KIE8_9SACH|nr:LANO_0G09582g1_1 [Lachancea nothofagi CBS 11611]
MENSGRSSSSKFGRRTWDREEYAQFEKDSRGKQDSIFGSLSDEQLQKLKSKYTNHSLLVKDITKNSNQRVLTNALTSYKKGKQFGFYCELCDLTFKDTLQFVDHLNHKIHQIKFERIFNEPLIADLRDNDDVSLREFDESYSSTIRDFLKSYGSGGKSKPGTKPALKPPKPAEKERVEQTGLNSVMGFGDFGSTKK